MQKQTRVENHRNWTLFNDQLRPSRQEQHSARANSIARCSCWCRQGLRVMPRLKKRTVGFHVPRQTVQFNRVSWNKLDSAPVPCVAIGDLRTYPHQISYKRPLLSLHSICVRSHVLCVSCWINEWSTTRVLRNGVFWDVTPCGSCKNRRFGGTWRLHHQGDKNRWTRYNASCN
jgi:hypothetical protein